MPMYIWEIHRFFFYMHAHIHINVYIDVCVHTHTCKRMKNIDLCGMES